MPSHLLCLGDPVGLQAQTFEIKSQDGIPIKASVNYVTEKEGSWPFDKAFRSYRIELRDFGVWSVRSSLEDVLQVRFPGVEASQNDPGPEWTTLRFRSRLRKENESEPATIIRMVEDAVKKLELGPRIYSDSRAQEGVFTTKDGLEFKVKLCTKTPISRELPTITTQCVYRRGDDVDLLLLRHFALSDPEIDCFEEYKESVGPDAEPSVFFRQRIDTIREVVEELNVAEEKARLDRLKGLIAELRAGNSYATATGARYVVEISADDSKPPQAVPGSLTVFVQLRRDLIDRALLKKLDGMTYEARDNGSALAFAANATEEDVKGLYDSLRERIATIGKSDIDSEISILMISRNSLMQELFAIEDKLDTMRERIYKLQERYDILRKQPHTKDGFIDLEQTKRNLDALKADLDYEQRAAPEKRQKILEKIQEIDNLVRIDDSTSPFSEFRGGETEWTSESVARFLTVVLESYSSQINDILGQPPSKRMHPERPMPEDRLEGRALALTSPTTISGMRIVRTKAVDFVVRSTGEGKRPNQVEIMVSANGEKWFEATITRSEAVRSAYLIEMGIDSLESLVKHVLYAEHPA